MISADCDLIRDDLDAFADGELRGDDLRRVSEARQLVPLLHG